MFDKLKKIRELQKQAKEIQNKLAEEIITAAEGEVEIKINGNLEVQSFKINDFSRQEEIEKDAKKAINKAIKEAQKIMAKKMMGNNLLGL